jgi:hypothetical protein
MHRNVKRSAGSSQQQEPESISAPNDDVPQEEPVDEAEPATPVGTFDSETSPLRITEQIDEVKDVEVKSQNQMYLPSMLQRYPWAYLRYNQGTQNQLVIRAENKLLRLR